MLHTKKRFFICLVLVVALSISFSISAFAYSFDWNSIQVIDGVRDWSNQNGWSGFGLLAAPVASQANLISNVYALALLENQVAYAVNDSSSSLMVSLNSIYQAASDSSATLARFDRPITDLYAKLCLGTDGGWLNQSLGALGGIDDKIAGFDTSFNDSMSNLYDLWDTLFDTVTVTNTQLTSILTVLSTIANNGSGGTVSFPNYIQIDPWLDSGQWKTPGETGYSVDSWWWDQSFYQHMIANDLSDFKDLFEDYASASSSSVDLSEIEFSLNSLKSYEDRLHTSSWANYSGSWYYRIYERLSSIANNIGNISGGGSEGYDPIIKDETAAAREVFHYISYDQNGMFHVSPDELWDFAYLFDDLKNFFASDGDPVDLFARLQDEELWSWFSDETAQSIDSTTSSVEVVDFLGW